VRGNSRAPHNTGDASRTVIDERSACGTQFVADCLTEPGERGPIDSHLRIARGGQDHTRPAVSRGPERRTPHRVQAPAHPAGAKDDWLWALGPTPWATTTQAKVNHQLWQLAQEIVRLGLSVVLDFGFAARIERDQVQSVARDLGVGVELHFLEVPVDELWRRIEARNSKPPWDSAPIRRTHLDEWASLFQAPDAAELALFDPPPDSD
jgi:hypothetical protein